MIPPQADPRPRNTWKYAIHKVSPNSIHLFYQFFPISGPNVQQKMSEGKTSQYMTFLKQVRLPELIWALPNLSLSQASINRFSSWWLNQPIWKICLSNWIISPEIRGEFFKKWNHQLVLFFPHLLHPPPWKAASCWCWNHLAKSPVANHPCTAHYCDDHWNPSTRCLDIVNNIPSLKLT